MRWTRYGTATAISALAAASLHAQVAAQGNAATAPAQARQSSCIGNGYITDGDFERGGTGWSTYSSGYRGAASARIARLSEDGGSASLQLDAGKPIAVVVIGKQMRVGNPYQLRFNLRIDEAESHMRYRVFGVRTLSGAESNPSATQLLHESSFIPGDFREWAFYTSDPFTALEQFEHLAVEFYSDSPGIDRKNGDRAFRVQLDNVGLCELADVVCTPSFRGDRKLQQVLVRRREAASEPGRASAEESQTTTINFGSASALYADREEPTVDGLLNPARRSPFPCDYIDEQAANPEDVLPEQRAAIAERDRLEAEAATFLKTLERWERRQPDATPDFLKRKRSLRSGLGALARRGANEILGIEIAEPSVAAVAPPFPSAATNTAQSRAPHDVRAVRSGPNRCPVGLDPSLPFGGRSIVYISGFQQMHLAANFFATPLFQERWSTNPEAFYKPSDPAQVPRSFYGINRDYWLAHIKDQLGSADNPTNSYVIANYSTNERLEWGIDAVATQIRRAMEGTHPDVVLSPRDRGSSRPRPGGVTGGPDCFGRNGIVIVSHSTGSLLASSMLGVAEMSRKSGPVNTRYGDLGWLSDATTAHLAFGGANSGSGLASAARFIMAEDNKSIPAQLRSYLIDFLYEGYAERFGTQLDLSQPPHTGPGDTVLVDLSPATARQFWIPVQDKSETPTLAVVGDTPGIGVINEYIPGQLLNPGFDDGVNPSTSQAALREPFHSQPYFRVERSGALWDPGAGFSKSLGMREQATRHAPNGYARYFVTPYLAPNGMIQSKAVHSNWQPGNKSIRNHFPIIQSTASHYDAATHYSHNPDYEKTVGGPNEPDYADIRGLTGNQIRNFEETAVLQDGKLIETGLVSQALWDSNEVSEAKDTIGGHFLCWDASQNFWCYYEVVLWKRQYLRLKGDRSDVDYAYDYVAEDYRNPLQDDMIAYARNSGTWEILTADSGFLTKASRQWGQSTDIPISGSDFDGDGLNDIAVWRPSNGTWYTLPSSKGFLRGQARNKDWGTEGDIPIQGSDFDGDGTSDFAVWRPSNGTWYILKSSLEFRGAQPLNVQWGTAVDTPLQNFDFDGDGATDIAVWRPSSRTLYSVWSTRFFDGANPNNVQWGQTGDIVVPPSDFDGDGKSDFGLWGTDGTWRILTSGSGFNPQSALTRQWGQQGDRIIGSSDFDGDGKDDIAVWRPPSSNTQQGRFFVLRSSNGFNRGAPLNIAWGSMDDEPVADADFDGDGRADLALWRGSDSSWQVLLSSRNFDRDTPLVRNHSLNSASEIPFASEVN